MKKIFFSAILALSCLAFVAVSSSLANTCGAMGTGSPGYWKNHPEMWPEDFDLKICKDSLDVATCTSISKETAIDYMDDPVKGDKWLTMFPAYVAATLNVAIGNCPPTCYSLGEVSEWLAYFSDFRPIKAKSEAWQYSHGEALYWCLDGYNNGLMPGIPSRDVLK